MRLPLGVAERRHFKARQLIPVPSAARARHGLDFGRLNKESS
jgi:hypothetical protein